MAIHAIEHMIYNPIALRKAIRQVLTYRLMITHFFEINSNACNLNIGIIDSMIKIYISSGIEDIKPMIILIKYNDDYIEKYIEFFTKINWVNYSVIPLRSIKDINKNQTILLHGPSYRLITKLYLIGANKLNWVCWGKGARINYYNIKSILFSPIKYFLYRKFQSVVTLLDGDKRSLINDYKLKSISTIPYYTELTKEELTNYSNLRNIKHFNKLLKICIGNSGNCIDEYLTIVDKLVSFRGTVEVHFMLSYGIAPTDNRINKLKKKCESIFGSDYYIDTEYLSYSQYLQYLNQFDVYICGRKYQTGLGAIYNCIELGKKIYIDGHNFEHIKKLGLKVLNIKDLHSTLRSPISDEDKECNRKIYESMWENIKNQWISYLVCISK